MSVNECNQVHIDPLLPTMISNQEINMILQSNNRIIIEKNSMHYSVAIKIINNFSKNSNAGFDFNIKKLKYVILNNIEDTKILANINSLSKQLKLSYFTILSASKKGKLNELIDQQLNILNYYEKVIKNYKSLNPEGKLNESTLLKVAGQAFEKMRTNDPVMLKINHEKFIAKIENNTLDLLHLTGFLGSGFTGAVYNLSNINTGQIYAYKMSHVGDEAGRQRVQKEYDQLTALNDQGSVYGIQNKPHKIYHLTYKGDLNTSYIGDKYDEDLYTYIKSVDHLSSEQVFENHLFIAHQLIMGLKFAQSRGLIHGDIKPENILIKKGPTGIVACIADWEDARHISLSIQNILSDKTFTPLYSPIRRSAQLEFATRGKEEFIKMQYQKDLFAIGSTLYQLFAKRAPYENSDGYPILTAYDTISYLPNPIDNLLRRMLDFRSANPVTADQIYKELYTYIKNLHPQLGNKIHAEILNHPGTISEFSQLNVLNFNRRDKLKPVQWQFRQLQNNQMGFQSQREAFEYLDQPHIKNGYFAVWPHPDPDLMDAFHFVRKPDYYDVKMLMPSQTEPLIVLIKQLLF